MVQRKTEKKAALLVALAIIVAACLFPARHGEWGLLHTGASFAERCIWQLRHANVFHALLNAWCLVAVTFNLHVTATRMLCLFAICAACPYVQQGDYMCGLSCFTIALTASNTFNVQNILYFVFMLSVFILLGFTFHNIAAYAHVYGAVVGLIWGFTNETLKGV